MIYRLGKAGEIEVDGKKALERFTYGCDRDFPNSCYYLSVMYLQGILVGRGIGIGVIIIIMILI